MFVRKIIAIFGRGTLPFLYHILLAGMSAALVLSLPLILNFLAEKLLLYWSLVGNSKVFSFSLELILTVLFLLFTTRLCKNWENHKISKMAKAAGLISIIPSKGLLAKIKIKTLKQKQGHSMEVMVIGSTGFRTFVEPQGELHQLLKDCQKARIMLLNPTREGASVRAKSIPNPEITPEIFADRIKKSIHFLKTLKAMQKNIRLKLYPDPPFLKMAVLGNYIWLQHYRAGLNGETMPKYVLRHDPDTGSLYLPFYQLFMERWNNPEIPEYDFETDQLIYRDRGGHELRREKLDATETDINVRRDGLGRSMVHDGSKEENASPSHSHTPMDIVPVDDFPFTLRHNLHGGLHPGGKQFAMLRARDPICEAAHWIALR
jgi:hypothetical protein